MHFISIAQNSFGLTPIRSHFESTKVQWKRNVNRNEWHHWTHPPTTHSFVQSQCALCNFDTYRLSRCLSPIERFNRNFCYETRRPRNFSVLFFSYFASSPLPHHRCFKRIRRFRRQQMRINEKVVHDPSESETLNWSWIVRCVSTVNMADENNEDDSWLYGSSNTENQSEEPNNDTEPATTDGDASADNENAPAKVCVSSHFHSDAKCQFVIVCLC